MQYNAKKELLVGCIGMATSWAASINLEEAKEIVEITVQVVIGLTTVSTFVINRVKNRKK